MKNELPGDRRVALEEAFFAKQNEALRQRLRAMDEARLKKEAFSAASGITDEAVIEKLTSLNIGSDTLAALSLVPLVAVAWADGGIDDRERNAAFSRAAELGLDKDDVSHRLFEQWLSERPPADLISAWKAYIGALSSTLTYEAKRTLKEEVMDSARTVATAAGGFLGIGGRISVKEENVLKDLESAFGEGDATNLAPGAR
jgi:hypothetical protein